MKIVGISIRKLRENQGITLRDLAKKSNVSASFLSQIETNKSSPSLATLKSIADSLRTTVSSLIGEDLEQTKTPVLKEKDRKVIKRIGKGINMYLLNRPDSNTQMETILFKLSKNADSGKESYKHFGQEFVLILKGSLEIYLSDEKYILNKGDTLYFNSSTPHSFRNIYNGETEALWVITPPTF